MSCWEPDGRWPTLRAEPAVVLERRNAAGDDALAYAGEYLVVMGTKRG